MSKTSISLAVKYRPQNWQSVVEQDTIKQILGEELRLGKVKRVLLFTGPAGCGKTTNGRIFANELESCKANIIELNGASNRGIESIRGIIENCKTKPLQGKYKIFILDECHQLTDESQNALLKLLEEPPSYCIFILCTTDAQKVIPTILSRAYRYDFQKISHKGIIERLNFILNNEKQDTDGCGIQSWEQDALSFIAKCSGGGMRDAITLLDKVIGYSKNITVDDVVKVLGVTNYDIQFNLLDALITKNEAFVTKYLNEIYQSGKDLKLFVKNFLSFVIDVNKYITLQSFDFIDVPNIYITRLNAYNQTHKQYLKYLLSKLITLNSDIKWETNPKMLLEGSLLLEVL